MDEKTQQLLTELAVVLPHYANELPSDLGDGLISWVERIEELLKTELERQIAHRIAFKRNPQGLG